MYHIAVVEDSVFDQKRLTEYLSRYERETDLQFQITVYSNGVELIKNYPENLDILLMDIMMDKMDGLKTARLVRRQDDRVLLIFITNMIQYAIEGYSVDAMDFIIKPISYTGLKVRLDRAILRLKKGASRHIEIRNSDGIHSIAIAEICYIETCNHKVIIHTRDQQIPANTSLSTLEEELQGSLFFRCHAAFLINLKYIDKIQGNNIWVNGQLLSISRYRRKDFLEAWAAYLGG